MSYEKQTWVTGETITADKLNRMEGGIKLASDELESSLGILRADVNPATGKVTNVYFNMKMKPSYAELCQAIQNYLGNYKLVVGVIYIMDSGMYTMTFRSVGSAVIGEALEHTESGYVIHELSINLTAGIAYTKRSISSV